MKFNVIYADPPWQQKTGRKMNGYKIIDGKQIWNSIENKSANMNYPTMTVEEISTMPIKEIAADNAHLYLWVTNKYLLEAKKVIEAWGFTYSTCITWKKKRMGGGLGGAIRITHEHLLFCRRGKLKTIGTIPESVIEAKRPYVNGYPCSSKKPEIFAELITQVSPGPYLELFARSERKGWNVFGNQVENSIVNPKNKLPCGKGQNIA